MMSSKTCSRCKEEKLIKSKGLCNACYTATCRETAKKRKMQEEKGEEEPNMNGLMVLLLKKEDENAMLRQKLEMLQNTTSLNTNPIAKEISLETTTIQVSNTQNSMNSGITVATTIMTTPAAT
jgi:hypothetical protein